MKHLMTKYFQTGTLLVGTLMGANVLNFIFNAYLGRELSYEQFGTITLIATLFSLVAIPLNALSLTINHHTGFLTTKSGQDSGNFFFGLTLKRSLWFGVAFSLLWLLVSKFIAQFFNVSDITPIMLFTPVIAFGLLTSTSRGYLQSQLSFAKVALLIGIEAISKLAIAIALVQFGQTHWVYLAIPLSVVTCAIFANIFLGTIPTPAARQDYFFPRMFFLGSIMTALATSAFLTVDVLLAKHYLSPEMAGQYSLLALVGKMIFFFGSLLNGFLVTFVSRAEGANKKSITIFYNFFTGAALFTLFLYTILGPFGHLVVPVLFGERTQAILEYLPNYTLAIALYTMANVLVVYHLVRKQFLFPVAAITSSVIMAVGIYFFHADIGQITQVIYLSSFFNFTGLMLLHIAQRNGKFILRNFVDLIDSFYPLAPLPETTGKKILIFNWRDTKHKYAGGAEVYLNELAKRWVKLGHHVTWFCGNDGHNPRNDTVDGVRIVRRGGLYLAFFWAFVYYMRNFRGKFDVILDCQNGVPFFAPMYAKEPVVSLLFHVHQEVFYHDMFYPLAVLAATIERHVMPWIYRHAKFVTISESTKSDMHKLGITQRDIQIVYPGIDHTKHHPAPKAKTPTILYLGRLKQYKSVDILIKAFKSIYAKYSNVKLVIAGDGEELAKLKQLATDLGVLKAIKFLGYVTETQKVKLMQQAWVFVQPSIMEGWGITIIEANACGTPVVASRVPGLQESVQNPHTGFLVPPKDEAAMTDRLLRFLTNRKLRHELSKGALSWSKNFSWDSSAKKLLENLS